MNFFLEAKQLHKAFKKNNICLHAVKNVSLAINEKERVGILGLSGCGKTTLAKLLMGSLAADKGKIYLNGAQVNFNNFNEAKNYYAKVQMVFQQPQASFHPRKSIGEAILLPLLNYGVTPTTARQEIKKLLNAVCLPEVYAAKYPHELSGGECQRAAIARAISIKPRLLICDEITAALDTQVEQQIIELLEDLQQQNKMSLLFISHDITLMKNICSEILIMQNGEIIEAGNTPAIFNTPQQQYTKNLLEAAQKLIPKYKIQL